MAGPAVRKVLLRGPVPGAQAAAFLARTSGLSNGQRAGYTKLINGLVADGLWSLLDALWVFATSSPTNANLNLINSSFGLTQVGGVTFDAGRGYTGNGTTGYFTTGYTPSSSGTSYTLNSATIGGCVLNSRTSSNSSVMLGCQITNGNNYIQPLASSTVTYNLNATNTFPSTANTNAQGSWILSRTGGTAGALYLNGVSFVSYTTSSNLLSTQPYTILANNVSGTPGSFSSDQTAYIFIGGGMTAAQSALIEARLKTYLNSIGVFYS